jgi:hypothetical protein
MLEVTSEVPGASDLIAWFGDWPSFHDAEVLDVALCRSGKSTIRVHTFEMTKEVDSRGFFICTKHVDVSFILEGITDLHFDGFNHQNVIWGLSLKQSGSEFELTLEGCYGIEGSISAKHVSIELHPGPPLDGKYSKLDHPAA